MQQALYKIIQDISIRQIIIDVLDGISFFFMLGVIRSTGWHRKMKLEKQWINFCLFVFVVMVSGGIGESTSKIGVPVDIFDRTYTVNHVAELKQMKNLKSAEYKGARFIKVNVSLKNRGEKPITISSDEIKLHTVENYYSEYKRDVTNEVLVNPPKVSLFQELNPGVTRNANILFVVPNNIPLTDLEVKIEKNDMEQTIHINGDVSKWPAVVIDIVFIIGLMEVFLLVGVVYPTRLHHDVKLDSRRKNLNVFFVGLCIIILLSLSTIRY